MRRASIVGLALAGVVGAAGAAWAHHAASTLGTVRLPQAVLVGGQRVDPGTYEVRLTGEHLMPLPGQSEDAGQQFELVANGQVVARDFAEVMPAPNVPVGTSGGAGAAPRVQTLRGGEFVRIAVTRGSERFLMHLALAGSR
ncbi:MAG: hypothetical protein HYU37_04480 [Acidobacteria bacterium]|nr:hypothetical protein [Acidobacteriota bacterium]